MIRKNAEKETSGSDPEKARQQRAVGLHFEQVSFSYPTKPNVPVLRKTSIGAEAGCTIALVGPSGAGKSSIVALIERFYDPCSGRIVFDGRNTMEFELDELRDRIALVSQEPDLFPGSIAYNIKLGRAHGQTVTDADVQLACQQCGLHDFITSLPEGYNTECGSNSSSQLSGGQRQRVAIARALVRQPDVLLLDEPTSALDAHSEQLVKDSLAEASQGRTTLIVAHRLASIRHADCIYVLDEGAVVEQGTHDDLVKQQGLYAAMAKAQSVR